MPRYRGLNRARLSINLLAVMFTAKPSFVNTVYNITVKQGLNSQ